MFYYVENFNQFSTFVNKPKVVRALQFHTLYNSTQISLIARPITLMVKLVAWNINNMAIEKIGDMSAIILIKRQI
jgi:hypothetical protein